MPFTIAHAAAALPLGRAGARRVVMSALVVGAMSPDFEYLLYLRTHRTISHTLPGLVLMCLPLSLAVLAVWHGLVKRPLAGLLPARLGTVAAVADEPFAFWPWRRLLLVSGSVLAGAMSHLVWDAFTHPDGWAVVRVGVLRHVLAHTGVPLYEVLQLFSSVVGMLALVVAVAWWVVRHPSPGSTGAGSHVGPHKAEPGARAGAPAPVQRAAALAWILGAAGAVALVNTGRLAPYATGRQALVTAALLGAMTGGAVAAVLYGALSRLPRARGHP